VEAYRPARDGATERNGKTEASTSSSLVANDDVSDEVNARLPIWFARNVRHVCDGVVSRWARYRDTVVLRR
jgi:hypothetical protein